MKKLHIDIETFSSADLKNGGIHVYTESPDFEILLVAYSFDREPIKLISPAEGEPLPDELINAFNDPTVLLYAHNAAFERLCFKAVGYDIPVERWRCTAVHASYCGFPLSLDAATKAMKLNPKNLKDNRGKTLIRYFCIPCKPTKTNGGRYRNFWFHDLDRWREFKEYCIQDVVAEKAIDKKLKPYPIPQHEIAAYHLDQKINDRGVHIDHAFAKNCIRIDAENRQRIQDKLIELTQLDNPNSPAQLKGWLTDALGYELKSIAADKIDQLIEDLAPGRVRDVLRLRRRSSKTSIKKYERMLTSSNYDHRARGLVQFYGACKTGRWAGRRVQPQNLPRTYLNPLNTIREHFLTLDLDTLQLLYTRTSNKLAQLIRTGITAPPGRMLGVADFSSIEARVLAWLAGEQWKLDVFNTHGKIYEAVASRMFAEPLEEEITKDSPLRAKGKVAELALGYQGWTGALRQVHGTADMTDTELENIAGGWRDICPHTVRFWLDVERHFKTALRKKGERITLVLPCTELHFKYDGYMLRLWLPSGRELFYPEPGFFYDNDRKKQGVYYWGLNQTTRKWEKIKTYGGKLTENLCQAVARDVLSFALKNLDREKIHTVMHVHDEVITEITEPHELQKAIDTMTINPPWSKGLPLGADGFTSPFYKKD